MDKQNLMDLISSYSGRALEQRKSWYSPAAEAYNRARPSYPQDVIDQVVDLAQLSSRSHILEVGCGPGTATQSFAALGCPMLCLEPNPNFYRLAVQNCHRYPPIEIENTSFEEWDLQAGSFDAVLAASSFHWIPAEVGYLKAAQALKPGGALILLWNKELQPSEEVYRQLSKIYQIHAPELDRYEDKATQLKILDNLGQIALDSGHFENVSPGYVEVAVTYTAEQYLTLLQTYSPYLKLETRKREALFEGLRDYIEAHLDGRIPLSHLSAFHIAQRS
ncbi:MAG: class I SAM-dependent methyltransferase [Thermosynechococcaceae cyanobacterium]